MARRFRFAVLFALLVATATALTACGGDDGGDADELLKATFGPEQTMESGNLAVSLSLDAKGLASLQGPVSLKLNGPFQSAGKGKLPKLDLSFTLTGGGANFSAGAVTNGEKGWLELQGTTYLVDDPTFRQFKEGYEQSAEKSDGDSGPSFKSLGVDPLRWLRNPEVAGSEDVGGAETHRITADVDVSAFLDDVNTLLGKAGSLGDAAQSVPTKLTEQQRKDIESSVKDASLEVWTGKDDKTLRRIKLVIDIEVPEDVRKRAGGLTTGTLGFDLVIRDLNEPQEISEPEDARPLDELKQLVAGGATGATPAPPAAATPAPPAEGSGQASGSGESSKYLECISAAGNDVAKIQECAALAGQ